MAIRNTSWTDIAKSLPSGLLHLLYPKLCWACQRLLPPHGTAFCDTCYIDLTEDPHETCWRCGSTVGPYTYLDEGCLKCRNELFAFEQTVRLGAYDGLLRELVLRMKHLTGESLAEIMGRLWGTVQRKRLATLQADVVVPVPLHWWRRWTRGYNQAETLARAVAKGLHLPCWPRGLRRWRYTPRQTFTTSATARRENVRGAFRARRHFDFQGKSVLLMDDVLTTGHTASEAARALKHAGAKRVVVAVLAHGH